MAKVLLVEDDHTLRKSLKEWLSGEGLMVDDCEDAESAIELTAMSEYDLLILDWNLPGMTGVDMLKQYRDKKGAAAVLMLTGKSEVDDVVTGLDCGADDYLTKPFKMRELSARVRVLLRRPRILKEDQVAFADLSLDCSSKRVLRGEIELKLPPREFACLEFLMRRKAEIFSSQELLRHVWSSDSGATDQTVRTCIKRIRQVIDLPEKPSYIDNLHGHGYRMNRALEAARETL